MAHQAWDVYLNGHLIDTVFYDVDCDEDYVRRGLIDHDGYDSGIVVKKPGKTRPKMVDGRKTRAARGQ